MTHARAMEIATQFMETMNPDSWNGVGNPPASFDAGLYEEPIAKDIVIEISFYDESCFSEGWKTCVELVSDSGQSYGIYTFIDELNSIEGIANCIEYLFDTYVKEGEVI